METDLSLKSHLKRIFIGKSRDVRDKNIFHKLSLIAFFAWVGLGADGISSSCYGPAEAFGVLGTHHALGLIVAFLSVITILVISASYSQIIELFPAGGGGYLVASQLLSPRIGMLSGSALLIDYVLTIAVSVSSGADALFSFLPPSWYAYRLTFALFGVLLLILLNLRGVKESVLPIVPVFLLFILTHLGVILLAVITHLVKLPEVTAGFSADVRTTGASLGFFGMIVMILRSFSMGAGTFTGIEAVSNGIPILREPRVQTAKRTMAYMAGSLAFMAFGLMLAYLLYKVEHAPGKTLNAVLFARATAGWGAWGPRFVSITLLSEAVLLFVAAQTGFLDGPRVLSNMAADRWVPTRFATLSDRLVTQNGILIMGVAAGILIGLTGGSVTFLLVLYSINVFITFSLSQLGMVRHWWGVRRQEKGWMRRLAVNGIGLTLTLFILCTVIVLKFDQGGWITLVVTGTLFAFFSMVKRHYGKVQKMLKRLDGLVSVTESSLPPEPDAAGRRPKRLRLNPRGRTAVVFVNGFNGLGLHTLFSILRQFPGFFTNFIFVQVGVVDAGNFKGRKEIADIDRRLAEEGEKYVAYLRKHGLYAEGVYSVGVDVVEEITRMAKRIQTEFPHPMFFGGQLVFSHESVFHKALHNFTIFSVHRRLHFEGIPVMIMPIRVY
jgi:amino acid transporter